MTLRETIHTALTGDAELTDLVDTRIAQGGSVMSFPIRPFLIHRLHTTNEVQGRLGQAQYFQLWAHDEPGDYGKVDAILARSRLVLEGIAHTGVLLEIRWLEDSQDFRDNDFGTICRYSRYQATSSTRERQDTWT